MEYGTFELIKMLRRIQCSHMQTMKDIDILALLTVHPKFEHYYHLVHGHPCREQDKGTRCMAIKNDTQVRIRI